MKQYIIEMRVGRWLRVEYHVQDLTTNNTLYAVRKGYWKNRIDVFDTEGNARHLLFSIRTRSLLALSYYVIDFAGNKIGLLTVNTLFSQLWQVIDATSGANAQTVSIVPSIHEDFRLSLDGQDVCLYSKKSSSTNPLVHLECLDSTRVNVDLMLSVGMLLLTQGDGSDGYGSAG